ncbi:hypothetical protein TorRG33x02_277840 [Trema orientale]|uniref:Putative plant transposon protein domain-containing protein n=1 Tax=Trema orientale TaxID=63057 RepID=A0A2P5CPJ5_TREOI|nr:hypothetical protein TorRG33x02_277840 [Trema orientale]
MDGLIAMFIIKRSWQTFIERLDLVMIPTVQEFCANAKADHEDYKVFVRIKTVSFSAKAISDYNGLPDFEEDEYTQYLAEELDYDSIVTQMCIPGIRAWFSFICANLMPTSYQTMVTKERAVLLDTIVTERSIDVRKVIKDLILHTIQASTIGGLTHPSLITALCVKVGSQTQAKISWGFHCFPEA